MRLRSIGVTFLSAYPRDGLRPRRICFDSMPPPAHAQVISRIVLGKSRAILALCEHACVRERSPPPPGACAPIRQPHP